MSKPTAEEIATFKHLDRYCQQIGDAIERVRSFGPVNRKQEYDLAFVEATIAELRCLFREEALRTGAAWWE